MGANPSQAQIAAAVSDLAKYAQVIIKNLVNLAS
jgi:hypothetical protein